MTRAIGSHHSASAGTTTWLTPPSVIDALGGWESFDLDPCAAPAPRPWPTARAMNAEADGDGLRLDWLGRVWLNPPYSADQIGAWMWKLAGHGRGTALIFARTETQVFRRAVWERATGLLFFHGRIEFHLPCGGRSGANCGAPSVLVAYGADDLDRLASSELQGAIVPLRFTRFVAIGTLDLTWSEVLTEWLARQDGPVSVSDAYRFAARHPKGANNNNLRVKVRQKLAEIAIREAPGQFRRAA